MDEQLHDNTLRLIVEGTAGATGEEFFRSLVRYLAQALGVQYAWVAEFTAVRTRVHTLAFFAGDRCIDNFEYNLDGAPCERVYDTGSLCHYRGGLQQLFPRDKDLATLSAESYLGIPLVDTNNQALGHLAMIDTKMFDGKPRDISVFKIFAIRAQAELERLRGERVVEESRARFSAIFASAMDAIITIDQDRKITLVNHAAEKIFGQSPATLVGQTIDPLLSDKFRQILGNYIFARRENEKNSLWLPDGVSAIRADGEEFPVEGSVSQCVVHGQQIFTIILRDVGKRKKAEEAILQLQYENVYLKEEIYSDSLSEEMIGESEELKNILRNIQKVAPTDSSVLLSGETGTGKELFARIIHHKSKRSQKMMVTVNCAALPSGLAESELFGHEKGSFTGATARKKGRFELADGGTIFLDEIGELALETQAKILRVIQEQTFDRVGGTQPIKVNVRVIAATNRDLDEMVKQGAFRMDLFYRLNIFPIHIPPLRERTQDLPLLINYFIQKFSRRIGKHITSVSQEAMQRLTAYHWPGNVRELANIVERAVILCDENVILPDHVGISLIAASSELSSLEESEKQTILNALKKTNGIVGGPKGAAKLLGVNRTTLISKMKKLKIEIPRT